MENIKDLTAMMEKTI